MSAENIRIKFLGKDVKYQGLLDVLINHNQQIEALLNNGFKENTLKGYKATYTHIKKFLKSVYDIIDIDAKDINQQFEINYEFFLRAKLGCSEISAQNTSNILEK